MASNLPHADDTPIRVLELSLRDRGLGKRVKKGPSAYRSTAIICGSV